MLRAYFEESGDNGYPPKSRTPFFTLSTLVMHEDEWLNTLDQIIRWRGYIRNTYGVSVRAEIKANHLVHGKGAMKSLSPKARRALYRGAMRFIRKVGTVEVFAVVVNKGDIKKQDTVDPFEIMWRYSIQRLERETNTQNQNIMLFPDEGHTDKIRRIVRRMRRHSVVNGLNRNALRLIEDPCDKDSADSYFIQMADLCAYAASRAVHPLPGKFDDAMWNELGSARNQRVNQHRGGPPGIVSWP
jgi:hypothetical protein